MIKVTVRPRDKFASQRNVVHQGGLLNRDSLSYKEMNQTKTKKELIGFCQTPNCIRSRTYATGHNYYSVKGLERISVKGFYRSDEQECLRCGRALFWSRDYHPTEKKGSIEK